MLIIIKKNYRFYKDILMLLISCLYDIKRYYSSTIYPYQGNASKLEGKLIKLTHSMEKRISFENHDPSFGRQKAYDLIGILEKLTGKKSISEIMLAWSVNVLNIWLPDV